MSTAAEKAAEAKARARAKREAEENAGGNAEGDAAQGEGQGEVTEGKEKKERRMPVYLMEQVDEIPEEAPRRPIPPGTRRGGGGRKSQYLDLFAKALEVPGTWFKVADYFVSNGALSTARAMYAGERQAPVGQWELAHRKVVNPEDPDGKRFSALYVKLHNADVEGVEFVNVTDEDRQWLENYRQRQAEKAAEGTNGDGDSGSGEGDSDAALTEAATEAATA